MSVSIVSIQVSSFLFGLGAVLLTSMTKYVADPYSKLPAITFWLMGSLSSISAADVKILLIPILVGTIPLILLRFKLNVLSFGEEEAKAIEIPLGILTSLIGAPFFIFLLLKGRKGWV